MTLSIVIPVLNQSDLASLVLDQLYKCTDFANGETSILVIDNGGAVPFSFKGSFVNIVRNNRNIGVYPVLKQGFEHTRGDIVAFFHSDLVIWEKDWNRRLIQEFKNQKLGMIGFIGSNEIDQHGGRGLGTTSNFIGKSLSLMDKVWNGSHAKIHGKVSEGFSRAAVVDGCSMIIRRRAWSTIGWKKDFPPHHFYDRLISTQLLEAGWNLGVLGIACDHVSGGAIGDQLYKQMAYNWLVSSGNFPTGERFDPNHNYDWDIYQLAERAWLDEYRDQKHIIPIRLSP